MTDSAGDSRKLTSAARKSHLRLRLPVSRLQGDRAALNPPVKLQLACRGIAGRNRPHFDGLTRPNPAGQAIFIDVAVFLASVGICQRR